MCSILLVEDHADTRWIFAKVLRSWGHEVALAESVEGGLAFLAKNKVEVILSDIGLPDGSGCDLIAVVRQSDPEVMAIAVTAYCTREDSERSRDAGFNMHFPKPVDLVALHAVLAAWPLRLDTPPAQIWPQQC